MREPIRGGLVRRRVRRHQTITTARRVHGLALITLCWRGLHKNEDYFYIWEV